MRLLLVGNFGAGNLGDELLKEYFKERFVEVEWQVISARPKHGEFVRLPFGLRSLFTSPWPRTLLAFWHSDGVVFGGGTLFTDIESVRACFLWGLHAWTALLMRRPIFLAFQGIGPFRTKIGKWIARSVLKRAAYISVRDEQSWKRVQTIMPNKQVIQSFDPVFSLLENKNINSDHKNVFIIIPRWNSPKEFISRAKECSADLSGSPKIRILSFQPEDEREMKMCSDLAHELSEQSQLIAVKTSSDLLSAMQGASLVLSARFHGAIAALALGIPFIAVTQGKGDKLASLPQQNVDHGYLRRLLEEGEAILRQALSQIEE